MYLSVGGADASQNGLMLSMPAILHFKFAIILSLHQK
jgi:hypothetical protein